jgi:hypothetical protein
VEQVSEWEKRSAEHKAVGDRAGQAVAEVKRTGKKAVFRCEHGKLLWKSVWSRGGLELRDNQVNRNVQGGKWQARPAVGGAEHR